MKKSIEDKVLEAFRSMLGDSEITLDTKLEDLGMDSLDEVLVLTEIEDELTIFVEDDDFGDYKACSIRDVCQKIEAKFFSQHKEGT